MKWFYNLGLAKKLTLAMAIVLSFTVFMGLFSIMRISGTNDFIIELADDWIPKSGVLGQLSTGCERMAGLESKLIAAATNEEKTRIEKETAVVRGKMEQELATYESMASLAEEKAFLSRLRKSLAGYLAELDKVGRYSRNNQIAQATAVTEGSGRAALERTRALIDDRLRLIIKEAGKAGKQGKESCVSSRNLILALMAVSLILGLWLTYFIVHKVVCRSLWWALKSLEKVADGDLTQNINVKSTEEIGQIFSAIKRIIDKLREFSVHVNDLTRSLSTSSSELLSTTENMNRSAHEQAGQTDQVASAVMEMSQTFGDVAGTAEEASHASRETSEAASAGFSTVAEVMQEMGMIVGTMQESSVTIGKLGQSSRKIGDIVATIEEVADMTNLLALNAAIEAARAGDHGRGFAVVADEVRALAERTGKATREIDSMIKAIQHDTAQAVTSMMTSKKQADGGLIKAEEASRALERIVEASGKSMEMIQTIAAATEEQSAVAGQVSSNVELIACGTRSSETAAEDIQESARNLAKLSHELEQAATWFKVS